MKLTEHKSATIGLILMLVFVLVGVSCPGCLSSSAEVDNTVTVAPKITTEIKPEANATVTAGNVDVSETVEAETTIADVIMRLLDDNLFRWSLIAMLITVCIFVIYIMVIGAIIIYGFLSGQIDPRKPFVHKKKVT